MISSPNLEQAEIIVSKYGALLSKLEPSIYGIAISILPYDKEEIKIAIQTLIIAVAQNDKNVQEGLIQAYVYLAQFIDDDKLRVAENGRAILEKELAENNKSHSQQKSTEDLELANQALQTINGIKSDMESMMDEIRLFIS